MLLEVLLLQLVVCCTHLQSCQLFFCCWVCRAAQRLLDVHHLSQQLLYGVPDLLLLGTS